MDPGVMQGIQVGQVASLAERSLAAGKATISTPHLWPLLEEGIRAYQESQDARINGLRLDVKLLVRLGIENGFLLPLWIVQPQGCRSEAPHEPAVRAGAGLAGGVDGPERPPQPPILLGHAQQLGDDGVGGGVYGPGNKDSRVALNSDLGFSIFPGVTIHGGLLSQGTIAGFGLESNFDGWLQGHMLYLRPQFRGRGLVKAYLDGALELCRREGLRGSFFVSTLDCWKTPRYGYKIGGSIEQSIGPTAHLYWRLA